MKKFVIIFIIVAAVTAVNIVAHSMFGANTADANPYFMWTMKIFNFLLLVTLLTVLLKEPAKMFFDGKAMELKKSIKDAQMKVAEAEQKLKDAEEKLKYLEEEIKELKESAKAEGQKEERLLKAEADETVRKILEKADSEIKGKIEQAKKKLALHVSELAIKLAQNKLTEQIDDKARNSFFDSALEDIKEKM